MWSSTPTVVIQRVKSKIVMTSPSSNWWTSCQNSDTNAVNLNNGNFNNNNKTNSNNQVFCGYEIQWKTSGAHWRKYMRRIKIANGESRAPNILISSPLTYTRIFTNYGKI